DSTLALTVASNRQPASVLGAGTALAVNLNAGDGLQTAVENNPQLPVGNDFTVEAWAFPATAIGEGTGFSILVEFGQASLGHLCDFGFNNNNLFLGTYQNDITDSRKVSTNTWSHVAVVVHGRSVTFYLNGEVSSTG